MNRSTLLLSLLLSCTVACSRKAELNPLGLQYEPPSGMALLSVEPGQPAVARFEGGLELRMMEGSTPKVTAPMEVILASVGVPMPGKRLNATDGTLPTGQVARYEYQQGTSRTLIYFIPLENRYVLVLYTAPERDYGPGSARVERSLSTLRPTR